MQTRAATEGRPYVAARVRITIEPINWHTLCLTAEESWLTFGIEERVDKGGVASVPLKVGDTESKC